MPVYEARAGFASCRLRRTERSLLVLLLLSGRLFPDGGGAGGALVAAQAVQVGRADADASLYPQQPQGAPASLQAQLPNDAQLGTQLAGSWGAGQPLRSREEARAPPLGWAAAAPRSSGAPAAFAAEPEPECLCPGASPPPEQGPWPETCQVSKVAVRQDHAGRGSLSLADVSAAYGGGALNEAQRRAVTLAPVEATSFMCLDDRVTEPSLVTPGGDLGEFILALAAYLQERGPGASGEGSPSQAEVDGLFAEYLETLPLSRPLVHCTDDAALRHLEDALPVEGLDLRAPSTHARELGLLQKLLDFENQGDSHIRLMLKQPEWFQLDALLVPMVLRAFYSSLWRQAQDPISPLHARPKLRLVILTGQSDPQAFLEVSSGELCHSAGMAPMLTPRGRDGRQVLISHLDAVSLRRRELAHFFGRVANATPRKIDVQRLHQRLDRHGWLALETTGSRMAMGLPFFTLNYS